VPPLPGRGGAAAAGPQAGSAGPEAEPAFDPEAAREAYKQAFSLLKSGNYDEATAAFNDYLVAYPASEHADNAQYWLAEAYYVTRRFEAAIGEYRKLMEAFPDSPKAPHAMLKIGYSLAELGEREQARSQLDSVRRRYPSTTAAKLAAQRLERLAEAEAPASP